MYDIIIIGAGPAGLACSRVAAGRGLKVLVIERRDSIGKKVCAGGITWNGLIQKIPGYVAEKEFPQQYIYSKYQQTVISAKTPIIATVNRVQLGLYMANMARNAGVEIITSSQVKNIDQKAITVFNKKHGTTEKIEYTYLVGADGSSSMVRKHLGIPVRFAGVGINYQVPGELSKMQWHFNSSLFANGYAWIFPHSDSVSIGAYADTRALKPALLKSNLLKWSEKTGLNISKEKPAAEFINYDYRGWRFNNFFLVGDAAGLASGLTGEGIYPAIISGEAVAKYIADPKSDLPELAQLIQNHKKHKQMASITAKSRMFGTILSEFLICSLRTGLIKFNKLEMAR